MEVKELPTCKHCETEWSYAESLKNLLTLRCPHCREKNFARKFRLRDIVFGITLPIVILFIFPMFNLSFIWTLTFAAIATAIYLATYPINLVLTKEEDPLF